MLAEPGCEFLHQNSAISSKKASVRRRTTVAICTLAVLAAGDLTYQAGAAQSQVPAPEQTGSSVVPVERAIFHLHKQPVLTRSIVVPESTVGQEFAQLSGKHLKPQSSQPSGQSVAGNNTKLQSHAQVIAEERRSLGVGEISQSTMSPASQGDSGVSQHPNTDVPLLKTPSSVPVIQEPAPLGIQSYEAKDLQAAASTKNAGDQGTPGTILAADPTATPTQEDIQKLQEQLRSMPQTPEFGKFIEGSPALTIVNPTGFGLDNNTGFVSASFQSRTRYTKTSDGALGIGVGLGDARKYVGVELSYGLASFGGSRSFGSGGFNVKVHHQFSESLAAAVGWNGFLNLGSRNDFQNSPYGVVTKIFRTRDDINSPLSRIAVSAGLGSGQFRTERDVEKDTGSVNFFGSVAVRVARPVSFITEWTGEDLTMGLSIVPFKNLPLVITPAVRDIVGAGDGPRFVLGAGFAFKF